jgi:hypothetical protein
LGDFNCAIQKNLDRNPPQQLDDTSVREFQSMLHRNDLFDVWRKLNPETKIYTFKRGFKDILPDKDPYHNRGRDQMRKKGGPEFECLWALLHKI